MKFLPLILLLAAAFPPAFEGAGSQLDYDAMAGRIVGALQLSPGERVLIRFDPGYFSELVGPLRERIRQAGAIDLGALEYAEVPAEAESPRVDGETARQQAEDSLWSFEAMMEAVNVYIWLPVQSGVREIPAAESKALQRWLDRDGKRRQIHFHWSAGSVLPDGLPGEHSPALDAIYEQALSIDHKKLSEAQERFIAAVREGTVSVRTPAGTNLQFRIGNRPFNKQDGDASPQKAEAAVVRVDREIELPAGVVRVAPIEQTVNGRIVIPTARFGDKTARNIRLEIEGGRVLRVEADEGLSLVQAALAAGGEAARRFREFGLGFNPRLHSPQGSSVLAYFGYGQGIVRLSLGDNEELGGSVRGNFVRWFFFPDASVEVDGRQLVRDGRILETSK